MFDYKKALQQGVSEDKIIEYLTKTRSYDVQGAIDSGVEKSKIIEYLAQRQGDRVRVKNPTKIEEDKSFLEKASDLSKNTFGKAADFMFGPFGETAGKALIGATESAAELIEGQKIPDEQKIGYGVDGQKPGISDIVFTALATYPGGGALSKYLRKIPGGEKIARGIGALPDRLKESAIRNYQRVLGATKNEFKRISSNVAPELAERKVTSATRQGLLGEATEQTTRQGEMIGEFIEQIPKETTLKTKPILDAIEETKSKFTVNGVVVEPEKLKVAENLQEIISQFGDTIDSNGLIQLRRVWDETIKKAGKGFGLDAKDAFKLEVKKIATNTIREELSKRFPDLAKINKEFSFWKGVKDTLEETIKRTGGQATGITETALTGAGAVAGAVSGGISKAIIVGTLAKGFSKLTKSALWETMSAKKKMQLAEAIESGSIEKITEVIKRLGVGIKNLFDDEE